MTVENPPPDVSQFQTEPQDEGVSIDFGRILGTVRKYFWVIVLFLVAGAISAVVYLNVATPIYQSFALLKVEQRVQNTGPSSMAPQTEDLRSLDMIGTIQRGFLTRSLMEEVTRKLKLVDRENFFPKGTPASDRTEAMCLAILMKNTTTRIERGTRFIMVMFDHPDPEIATEVTRALVDNYIALDAEQRVKSAAESISYLKLEVEETKSKLEQSERALTKYAEEVGTVSVDSELNIIASTLLELNSRLTIAKAERLKLAADYEQIELVRDDPDALLQITSIDSTPEVQGLRSELNALDAEIGRVRQRYGPRSPQSIELQDQRAQLMESLRAAALRAPKKARPSVLRFAAAPRGARRSRYDRPCSPRASGDGPRRQVKETRNGCHRFCERHRRQGLRRPVEDAFDPRGHRDPPEPEQGGRDPARLPGLFGRRRDRRGLGPHRRGFGEGLCVAEPRRPRIRAAPPLCEPRPRRGPGR